MSIKETAQQHEILGGQLWKSGKEAFEVAKKHLILRGMHDEDDDYVHGVYDWRYSGYEVGSAGIKVNGEAYIGCGEYDYTSIHIPYTSFDDLEAWAVQKEAEYADEDRKRLERKAVREAEEEREVGEAEHAQYLKLREKFEGAKQ